MTNYKLPAKFQQCFAKKYWEQTDEQLDQLVKSDQVKKRELAACFGRNKDLDVLISDLAINVRRAVAYKGRQKDLDILVKDSSPLVREAVAYNGSYDDLAILAHDKDAFVRLAVITRLGSAMMLYLFGEEPYDKTK